MSDTPESVDLTYIGGALQRLTMEVATLRDDVNVMAAIVRRIDNNQDRMLDGLRNASPARKNGRSSEAT